MIARLRASFSSAGIILGLLFLCASLTPSLLPRVAVTQGALSGAAFAVGYGLGVLGVLLWQWLGFPLMSERKRLRLGRVLIGLALGLTLLTFFLVTSWQNTLRGLMEMPDVSPAYPFQVAAIALVIAVLLILAARGVIRLARLISGLLGHALPRNSAIALGTLLAVILVIVATNDLVIRKALQAADQLYDTVDRATDPGITPPDHSFASGGPASGVDWDDIGANGKDFLVTGPTRQDITDLTGRPAMEPLRVYAGFRSGDGPEERAQAAYDDLVRLGGFERSVLIVATPTGTGWLDPAGIEPITYMHNGDLAIVASQYSYLPSWLTLILDPDRSRRAAHALFLKVYDHWTALPHDTRPELYLFGLSLGALGSEASADLATLLADPIDGAFWAGPPFPSTVWGRIVAGRNADSPAWLPEFRDGSLVRFMNQDRIAVPEGGTWGQMRVIYLQYASDPMVNFSTSLAWRRPDWLGETRGPDVSPKFDWYPLVTFMQVGFDVLMATTTPSGHGHTYDALDYIEGWLAVTHPSDWTVQDTEKLNTLYTGFTASPL